VTLEAATPPAAVKARYFDESLHSTLSQEDRITQNLVLGAVRRAPGQQLSVDLET